MPGCRPKEVDLLVTQFREDVGDLAAHGVAAAVERDRDVLIGKEMLVIVDRVVRDERVSPLDVPLLWDVHVQRVDVQPVRDLAERLRVTVVIGGVESPRSVPVREEDGDDQDERRDQNPESTVVRGVEPLVGSSGSTSPLLRQ